MPISAVVSQEEAEAEEEEEAAAEAEATTEEGSSSSSASTTTTTTTTTTPPSSSNKRPLPHGEDQDPVISKDSDNYNYNYNYNYNQSPTTTTTTTTTARTTITTTADSTPSPTNNNKKHSAVFVSTPRRSPRKQKAPIPSSPPLTSTTSTLTSTSTSTSTLTPIRRSPRKKSVLSSSSSEPLPPLAPPSARKQSPTAAKSTAARPRLPPTITSSTVPPPTTATATATATATTTTTTTSAGLELQEEASFASPTKQGISNNHYNNETAQPSPFKPLIRMRPLQLDGTPSKKKKQQREQINETTYDIDIDTDTDTDIDMDMGIACTSPTAAEQYSSPQPPVSSPARESIMVDATTTIVIAMDWKQLNDRMVLLFGQGRPKLVDMACVLPRLVAAFTLCREAKTTPTANTTIDASSPARTTKRRRRKQSDDSSSSSSSSSSNSNSNSNSSADVSDSSTRKALEPILELLQTLVDLEVELLDSEDDPDASPSSRKKVHFAAFDGSALQPPSDVQEGSYKAQQACIEHLQRVQRAIANLKRNSTVDKTNNTVVESSSTTTTKSILQELVDYWIGDFCQQGHASVCATSLSSDSGSTSGSFPSQGPGDEIHIYPPRRVKRAAAAQVLDFQQLLKLLSKDGDDDDTDANSNADADASDASSSYSRVLSWNCRLADTSAQLIRYWLRTELNPVPDRAPSESYTDGWNCRVSELVCLQESSDNAMSDPAVAIEDGSLSSLVSDAASHIFHYCGGDWKHWKTTMDATPTVFCQSELCQRGIASSAKGRDSNPILGKLSQDDWDHVALEMERATGFLAAVNGAKFLYELLTIVVAHPLYLESWKRTILKSAKLLLLKGDNNQSSLQASDAHLCLLGTSPETLLEQLPVIIDWQRKASCQTGLEGIQQRFLFATTTRNHYNKNNKGNGNGNKQSNKRRKRFHQPHLKHLEDFWRQAMAKSFFPVVVLREDDDDDENDGDEIMS